MNQRKLHWTVVISTVSAVLAGGLAVAARAQSQAPDQGEFDCVIEPRSVVKLGSAERGILAEITADRGAIVKKGDVVARLNSDLEALAVETARARAERDVEVRSSSARYDFKKLVSDRSEELYSRNIASAKVREEATIEKQLAEFAVAAAKTDLLIAQLDLKNAKERLDRRTIRSSVDGVVVQVTMAPGEFVQEQSPIMTLAQIDPLYVEMFVPISRYGTVSVGMSAKVMPEAPVGGIYVGRVQIVDRVFDTASGTFGVRLELPNPDYKLPAGLKCRIRFLPPGQ
jgi:RND family efflux transporter MFP subunit